MKKEDIYKERLYNDLKRVRWLLDNTCPVSSLDDASEEVLINFEKSERFAQLFRKI